MQGLVSDLEDFAEAYCTKHSGNNSNNINNMWTEFKTGIVTSMDKHIPSKMLSSSTHTAPWITTPIKRQIRKRDRLYERAKTSNENRDWEKIKNQKNKVQSDIRKSYWCHVEDNILLEKAEEDFKNAQKKFWKHIKSVKKDRTGTAPLKENGLLYSNLKSKADILNRQCQSVFSHEDLNNIPELMNQSFQQCPRLQQLKMECSNF